MDDIAKNIVKCIALSMSNPDPHARTLSAQDIADALSLPIQVVQQYLDQMIQGTLIVKKSDDTYFMTVEQVLLTLSLYVEYLASRITALENP